MSEIAIFRQISTRKKGGWEKEEEANRLPHPGPEPQGLSDKARCDTRAAPHPPTAQECRLATGDALRSPRPQSTWQRPLFPGDTLVYKNFNLNPTVLGPPSLGLVRRRLVGFTIHARSCDVPYRHPVLDQVVHHSFRAGLA